MLCSLLSKPQIYSLIPNISIPQFLGNSLHLEVKSSRDTFRPSTTLLPQDRQTFTGPTNLVSVSLTWPVYFCIRMQSCPALSSPKDVQADKNRGAVFLAGQKHMFSVSHQNRLSCLKSPSGSKFNKCQSIADAVLSWWIGCWEQPKSQCHSGYHLQNKLPMSSTSTGSCINDSTLPCLNQGQALVKQGQKGKLETEAWRQSTTQRPHSAMKQHGHNLLPSSQVQ